MVSAEIVNAEIVFSARPEGRVCVLSLGTQPQEKHYFALADRIGP